MKDRGILHSRPAIWGIAGTGRFGKTGLADTVILYVDAANPAANDNSEGTDPEFPFATLQAAVNSPRLTAFSTIAVIGNVTENVVIANTIANYCTLVGAGSSRHAPEWTAANTALPCLTVNTEGWVIDGFTFNCPAASAGILLNDTVPLAGDSAYKTTVQNCIFDGLWGGRYGISLNGAPHRVRILDNQFLELHNGGNVSHAIFVAATPNASPYECEIIGNLFWENDNHIAGNAAAVGFNVSVFKDNIFHEGELIATALKLDLRGGSRGNNIVTGNIFHGDYSNPGGYYANAGDPGFWMGNLSDDTAEAEVADNGWTIAPPAA